MPEQITFSALVMDRSEPLGNSLDVFTRRALHVKIGNLPSEPIPTYITNNYTPIFFDSQDSTDPGSDKTILSGTLAKDTFFTKLDATCRTESKIVLKVNGVVISSLRTGAAKPNASFSWSPHRLLIAGDAFEVIITTRAQSPINEVEAYLMGLEK